MDTAAFRADLELIPATLAELADTLDAGIPGLERLPTLGAARVLVLGMGSSRYAADVVARRYRAVGANVVVELASASLLPPAAPDLAIVAVSATGGSAEVLRAVERYRGTGRLVAVPSSSSSTASSTGNVARKVRQATPDASTPAPSGTTTSAIRPSSEWGRFVTATSRPVPR